MRAATYARARFIGAADNDATATRLLERQQRDLDAECAEEGWEVVTRYGDLQTGAGADDASFGPLLVDMIEGRYDVLVVTDLTRLARSAQDRTALRVALETSGCSLYLIGTGIVRPELLT